MHEFTIFNQKIAINTCFPIADDVSHELKWMFIKNSFKALLKEIYQFNRLPKELLGYVTQFELSLDKYDFSAQDNNALFIYLGSAISRVASGERLYTTWFNQTKSTPHRRPSFLLDKLRLRIFSKLNEVIHEIERSIDNAILHIKKMLEEDIKQKEKAQIIAAVNDAILTYKHTSIWPIHPARILQVSQLLAQLNAAPDPHAAMKILQMNIFEIAAHHVSNGFLANYPLFKRESRLVYHLQNAYLTLAGKAKVIDTRGAKVLKMMNQAIDAYLAEDIFYHHRARRRMGYQLLMQLQEDLELPIPERFYKMRMTIDYFIEHIDNDYQKNSLAFKFFPQKRSRLAYKLECAKTHLITNNILPPLNLELNIKKPILDAIAGFKKDVYCTEIEQEMSALSQAIESAHTPHGIEVMIEGHIRSYFQAATQKDLFERLIEVLTGKDDQRFVIAIQLENALQRWQEEKILPACSGYQTFLSTLAANREINENALQLLEGEYRIKIPRQLTAIKEMNDLIKKKANQLLIKLR